ncbi:hypothetical protein EDEG_03325 [Edhazardia aedis USNM 41457]|uniref:Uncharacterized protein n=1 Tax=Edhazardia aedis (strain USNM 41457) TaxID=1003232 RepID=J9D337_EDHAE|nr:hypothetical protein EDEG_03325 [Edhazardia aedis USNM 41457]|eukprot:EJW02241.1 hypothetical protein EDEG_03325 [Edhazardia aedis USNM 41457]
MEKLIWLFYMLNIIKAEKNQKLKYSGTIFVDSTQEITYSQEFDRNYDDFIINTNNINLINQRNDHELILLRNRNSFSPRIVLCLYILLTIVILLLMFAFFSYIVYLGIKNKKISGQEMM